MGYKTSMAYSGSGDRWAWDHITPLEARSIPGSPKR